MTKEQKEKLRLVIAGMIQHQYPDTTLHIYLADKILEEVEKELDQK